MNRMLFRLLPVFLVLALIAGGGCSDRKSREREAARDRIYPKIMNHKLEFRVISKKAEFYRADPNPVIRVQLINNGLQPVTVYEWKLPDELNVMVSWAELKPGEDPLRLPANRWKDDTHSPDPRLAPERDFKRYPLELCPKNSTFLDVPLACVREFRNPGHYAVQARLMLNSLPLRTVPLEIIVR